MYSKSKEGTMKQHLTGYSLIHNMQLDGRHALSEFHTHAFDLFSKAVLYPSFPWDGDKTSWEV